MKSNRLKMSTILIMQGELLSRLEWEFIQKYSPVSWLHIFVETGKTMIKIVFSLTILLYTIPTIVLFLWH